MYSSLESVKCSAQWTEVLEVHLVRSWWGRNFSLKLLLRAPVRFGKTGPTETPLIGTTWSGAHIYESLRELEQGLHSASQRFGTTLQPGERQATSSAGGVLVSAACARPGSDVLPRWPGGSGDGGAATRSAAGTIRRNSHTGCRPRLADPSGRRSPRGLPLPRMDCPESPRQRCHLGPPQWGICLLQVKLPGLHLEGVVLPPAWSPHSAPSLSWRFCWKMY